MATANLKITSLKVRILYFAPAFGVGSMCFGYFITYRCRQNMQEFQDKIDELRARFQEVIIILNKSDESIAIFLK